MNYPPASHRIIVLQVGEVISAEGAIQAELSRWGYNALLLRASTPEELCQALDQEPDLVLSGLDHAGLEIETVQRILRERQSPAALIGVCAGADEERAFECLRGGVDDILLEDHLKWLGPIVDRALNRRQMATRLAQDQLYIELLHETVGLAGDGSLPSDYPRAGEMEKDGRQAAHTHALANLAGRLSASLDLDQVLATLGEEVTQALDCATCVIFLYDEIQKQFLPARGQGISPEAWSWLYTTPLEINRKWAWIDHSATSLPRLADGNPMRGSLMEAYWCGYHLLLAGMVYQGRWIGGLGVTFPDPDGETCEEGSTLLQAFANQAAIAISNVRYYQQLRNRATELENLAQISSRLRRAGTLTEIIPLLASQTVEALHADRGAVVFLPNDRFIQAAVQKLPPPDPAWQTLFDQIASRQGFQDGRVYISGPTATLEGQDGEILPGVPSYALVLLRSVETPIGALCVGYQHPHRFEEDEKRLLVAVAEMAGNAIIRLSVMETFEQRVQVRTRELEALYDIAGFANQSGDLDQILEKCLETVLDLFHIHTGLIQLLSEDKKSLILSAVSGIPRHNLGVLDRTPVENSLWNRVIRNNRSTLSTDFRREVHLPDAARGKHPPTFLGTPIRANGEVLGVVSIFRETPPEFSADEITLFETIANQIGVAIDSAKGRLRSEETAILEERQRLARDLHDSVTQSLYSLSMLAEGYRRHAREAKPEELDGWFTDLGNAAHQALKDMRLLLYELRPFSLQMDGIVVALNRRLEAVEERSGIETHFKIEGNLHLLEKKEEVELYHIAQEALNNSLKHANASRIEVRLAAHRKDLCLEIRDDGVGFDATQIRSAGMGLLNMIDRAKKLGGDLFIHSWPGKGTRIEFYREGKG